MRLKILDAVLATLLILVAITLIINTRVNAAGQQTEKVKVNAVQLEAVDGGIPLQLEIIPETTDVIAKPSSPGSSNGNVHFKMKNNSTKRIEAYGVEILVTVLDINGNQRISRLHMATDRFPHPYVKELHQKQWIEPGTEATSRPRNFTLDNTFTEIKGVTLKVDFVLFDDGTFLNSSKDAAESILGRRRGAVKYHNWARKFYLDNNESNDKLFEYITKDSKLPPDLSLGSVYEESGAKNYRDYLIMLYNRDKTALKNHLMEEK